MGKGLVSLPSLAVAGLKNYLPAFASGKLIVKLSELQLTVKDNTVITIGEPIPADFITVNLEDAKVYALYIGTTATATPIVYVDGFNIDGVTNVGELKAMLTANSKAISTVANTGIMQGDGNGKVRPNDDITRAEAATLVVNFVDTDITGEAKFTDTSNHWAAEAINRVAAAGWITGNGDDKLLPNDKITCAEVVAIFNRILKRANGDLQMLPQMKQQRRLVV